MKARFEFDSALYDPLSIAALYGLESTFRNMLEQASFDKHAYNLRTLYAGDVSNP
jgi:hypothetical protein